MMKPFLILLLVVFIPLNSGKESNDPFAGVLPGYEIKLKPPATGPSTELIQNALDSCASLGGGTVRLTQGKYLCGTIILKSNVTIRLDKGVLVNGSDKYADYRNDAFFYGRDLKNVSITGYGIIDGVDCYNPKGEEGFRGPHCIKLINCSGIVLKDITIKNSANWAINCRYCSGGNVTNVTILGGHDGLHTRFCDNYRVTGCDFRTGDDAFAGNDNHNFDISDCKINTSCNGFRMGCMNLTVKRCTFWGPGEYIHKIQKRNNMLSAFVHFSPKDENPKLRSGNWVIEDITVSNVDNFYIYNFENGLWQTGQAVTDLRFRDIKATGILKAFYLSGDPEKILSLSIENSSFSFRNGNNDPQDKFEGARLKSSAFLYAGNFGLVSLKDVTLEKQDSSAILVLVGGKKAILDRVYLSTGSEIQPFLINKIDDPVLNKIYLEKTEITGKAFKSTNIIK